MLRAHAAHALGKGMPSLSGHRGRRWARAAAGSKDEHSKTLAVLEDAFGAECNAAVCTAKKGGLRGLHAEVAVRSSPVAVVPLTAALSVPTGALGTHCLLQQLGQRMPGALVELLAGRAPGCQDVQGLCYLQLASALLWLRSSPGKESAEARTAAPLATCSVREAWQLYAHEVLPPLQDLTCLLAFSAEETQQLQDPELIFEAAQQRQWAEQLHQQWLGPPASAGGGARSASGRGPLGLAQSLDDTLWALGQARSRSFSFRLRSGRATTLMAPFVDLANHAQPSYAAVDAATSSQSSESPLPSPPAGGTARQPPRLQPVQGSGPSCEVLLEEGQRGRLLLQPLRPLAEGTACTLDYSWATPASNLDLLTSYGFVVPGNPNDCLDLTRIVAAAGVRSSTGGSNASSSALSARTADGLPMLHPPHINAAAIRLHARRQQQQQQQQQQQEEGQEQQNQQHPQQQLQGSPGPPRSSASAAAAAAAAAAGAVALAATRASCALRGLLEASSALGHSSSKQPAYEAACAAWLRRLEGALSDQGGLGRTSTKQDAALLLAGRLKSSGGSSSSGSSSSSSSCRKASRQGAPPRELVAVRARLERKVLLGHVASLLREAAGMGMAEDARLEGSQ